jgi:BirA family biotin operon repressor/biotin-[acetyl-CoA-carboxylase] ligase
MATTDLIELLADGNFRSGQDLALGLGVSRTAIWKQVNKLTDELGLEVESVRGRGYRIAGGLDLLDAERVLAGLGDRPAGLLNRLCIHQTIDSTNSEALRQAQQAWPAGYVCTAEQQTAGRGRRGRRWISPFASNIYLSVLWEYEQGAAALEGLSLAVGVAVADALGDVGIDEVQLKWPNDILHNGAKLGGVLLEMVGDTSGRCQVVVGVGLNVKMSKTAAAAIDQAWTDADAIASPGSALTRNALLSALLNRLLPLLADFEQQGFSCWRDQWQARDAFAGRRVVLDTGSTKLAGTARGVNERGALLLATTAGVQAVYGGEISVRLEN